MKLWKILLTVAIVCLAAANDVLSKDFEVKDFSQIVLAGPFRYDIFQGDEEFVHVSCLQPDLLDNFVAEQEKERLSLRLKNNSMNVKGMKVTIGVINLKKLVVHQTASATVPSIDMEEVTIQLQHVADLKVGEIRASKVFLSLTETSTATFQKGEIGQLQGKVENVSTLKAGDVVIDRTVLQVRQISKATIQVKTLAQLTAEDMSQIHVGGTGKVSKQVDLMSQVVLI